MYDGGSNPSGDANYFICMAYNKSTCCEYCSLSFENLSTAQRANHSRWCDKNPKSIEYKEQLSKRAIETNTGRKRSEETKNRIKQAHRDGKYAHLDYSKINISRPHTEETKELLRQKALASPHRRLKRKMIEYKGIWLDSTWELVLAQRLDEQNIKWIRPEPIKWVDTASREHHYFPDFYLPEYDLYLDPKNPQAVKTQKKKIEQLLQQHSNIKILYSIVECKEFTP